MIKKYLFIIFTLLVLFSCHADKLNYSEIIKEEMLDFNIQIIRDGFFLSENEKSFLVLSENPKWKYDQNKISIHDSRVMTIDKNGMIEQNISLDFGSTEYNDYVSLLIQNVKKNIPNWNDYTAVYDFNGNGLDEIFTLSLTGLGIDFVIYEYNGESFEWILDDTKFVGLFIKDIEFIKIGNDKKFLIKRIVNDVEQIDIYKWIPSEQKYLFME